MKVPTLKRGNPADDAARRLMAPTSMKVPARRRGNPYRVHQGYQNPRCLNESPRPKAGKSADTEVDSPALG